MQGTITVTLVPVIFCPRTNVDSPRVDNHSIQWRRVCNNSFFYTFTQNQWRKNYDEERKEGKKTKKKSVAHADLARFELGVVGL